MEIADLFGIGFLLTAVIFIGVLAFLILSDLRSWAHIKDELNGLTVLITFKNEMAHLPELVVELNKKIYLNPRVSVWLLNDHSTDLSAANFAKLELNDQIKLFPPTHGLTGKKAVWRDAISRVATDWVLIMDVDAEPPESLFNVGQKIIPRGAKLLLIPIIPTKRKGAINSFFDLDFLSLHFAGLASAKANKPLLANAACILINREAFLESAVERNDWTEPGGDDVFAMFAIAKTFGSGVINILQNPNSFARVRFPEKMVSLWNQRLRWISKTGKIKNPWFQFVSLTVLITQIFFLGSPVLIFIYEPDTLTILSASLIIIAELIYLVWASAKLKRPDLWLYILPAIFIYPFYLLALVIFGTFAKPKWK